MSFFSSHPFVANFSIIPHPKTSYETFLSDQFLKFHPSLRRSAGLVSPFIVNPEVSSSFFSHAPQRAKLKVLTGHVKTAPRCRRVKREGRLKRCRVERVKECALLMLCIKSIQSRTVQNCAFKTNDTNYVYIKVKARRKSQPDFSRGSADL